MHQISGFEAPQISVQKLTGKGTSGSNDASISSLLDTNLDKVIFSKSFNNSSNLNQQNQKEQVCSIPFTIPVKETITTRSGRKIRFRPDPNFEYYSDSTPNFNIFLLNFQINSVILRETGTPFCFSEKLRFS